MSKIMIGVPYIEAPDLNPDASLNNIASKGSPKLVMVYASWCPHCQHAMKPFQDFVAKTGKGLAVHTDGGEADKQANAILTKVNPSPGVPAFLGFDSSGKFVSSYQGERTADGFEKFVASLN